MYGNDKISKTNIVMIGKISGIQTAREPVPRLEAPVGEDRESASGSGKVDIKE